MTRAKCASKQFVLRPFWSVHESFSLIVPPLRCGISIPIAARWLFLTLIAAGCTPTSGANAAGPKADLGPGFALDDGHVVVKNAKVDLARTYWSVVRAADGSHFLLPRPDGAAPLARECEAGTALATQLTDHALCNAADSEASVAKVNALDEALALDVSTVLHRDLAFKRAGEIIDPSPLGRDVLELCRTDAELRDGAMKERCREEETYSDGSARPAIFRMWTEAELDAVPGALNKLYGVK